MGAYYPVEELLKVGREVSGNTYSELVGQLIDDELLFGHYQWRDSFPHCPQLFSQEEFNEFESPIDYGVAPKSIEGVIVFDITPKGGRIRHGFTLLIKKIV